MKIKDLKNVLYSSRGSIIYGIVYDLTNGEDIDRGTVEYIYNMYGDMYLTNIVPSGKFEIVFQVELFSFNGTTKKSKKVKENIISTYHNINDIDELDNGYMGIEDLVRFKLKGALDFIRKMSPIKEYLSDEDLIDLYGDYVFTPEDFGEEFWIYLR